MNSVANNADDDCGELFMQILRNSFGPTWGFNGYLLIQRGVNLCHVEEFAEYTTVA